MIGGAQETRATVTLGVLEAEGLGRVVRGDSTVVVAGVRHDSREVLPGELFVAMPGATTDGARFCDDALANGAVALALEESARETLDVDAPLLEVDDARVALGAISRVVYGDPTAALATIGLTGTNGKTTTTWLIDEALTFLGQRPALLGTIESRGPNEERTTSAEARGLTAFTTPEGDAIARFARRVLDAGATHLVMEVSSHALALHRVDAVRFRVAGFTNLSQDHLDFHATMEAYLDEKARLFTELSPACAVINVDDPAGRDICDRLPSNVVRIRVSSELSPSRGPTTTDVELPAAELTALSHSVSRAGIVAELAFGEQRSELRSPMLGAHNLENLLLAAGCLLALDFPLDEITVALGRAVGAPGRLERIEGLDDIAVLVDYAHTPDALQHALTTLRAITAGRVFVVFGCGGDRDRQKRVPMGRAAGEGADIALLTSDNPRTEDPYAILGEVKPGLDATALAELSPDTNFAGASAAYVVIEDRKKAIHTAIASARAGDTVLIAGKGHEDYQIRGTRKLHFDDRETARAAIAARLREA